jgi:hypothetical protein
MLLERSNICLPADGATNLSSPASETSTTTRNLIAMLAWRNTSSTLREQPLRCAREQRPMLGLLSSQCAFLFTALFEWWLNQEGRNGAVASTGDAYASTTDANARCSYTFTSNLLSWAPHSVLIQNAMNRYLYLDLVAVQSGAFTICAGARANPGRTGASSPVVPPVAVSNSSPPTASRYPSSSVIRTSLSSRATPSSRSISPSSSSTRPSSSSSALPKPAQAGSSTRSSGMSTGAKAGAAVGAVLGAILIGALLLFLWRRRQVSNRKRNRARFAATEAGMSQRSGPVSLAVSTPNRHSVISTTSGGTEEVLTDEAASPVRCFSKASRL